MIDTYVRAAIGGQRKGVQARGGNGWQLILADLALILFLLTLSALPSAEAETARRLAARAVREERDHEQPRPEIAPAQALFRPVPGGPELGAWLKEQAPDPRVTLTIFAVHAPGEEAAAWARTEALADEARRAGARVRTIITAGTKPDLYAALAYDTELSPSG
ncbi:MAG: hypothetical protein KAF27_05275 [Porphyrobacter sp.]|nr:hypothetical protein [Porphyrobacter sp.]